MKIKKLPLAIASLFLTITCLMSSCLKNDVVEYTYSSNSSITSFSLGTLKVKKTGKYTTGDKAGQDSVYYVDVDMSKYPFTIDQARRTIENKDSLPIGTDTSRVILKINADTQFIMYGKISKKGAEPVDTIWNSTDSVDFSNAPSDGLKFQVIAESGAKGKPYQVKINVHSLDPDSLKWFSPLRNSNSFVTESLTQQRAVFTNNRIFVFGKDNEGRTHIEYCDLTPLNNGGNVVADSKPSPWKEVEGQTGQVIEKAVSTSALLWQDVIYFISENTLYTLNPSNLDIKTAKENPSDFKLTQLIAGVTGNDFYTSRLYACTTEGFVSYSAEKEGSWTEDKTSELENFTFEPESRFSAGNLPVAHNNTFVRTVVMSANLSDKSAKGNVIQRLNSENQWIKYNYNQIDTLGCPNIADVSMLYYNKKLYAFGGEITSKQHEKFKTPFSTFFKSDDNGLTWKPETYIGFPIENEKNLFEDYYKEGGVNKGSYSAVADNHHFIWIIWHDGSMSHGRINHLGFAPKW